MKRQTLWFSAIMIVLLMVMYLPQMMRPGGINFGVIQDITNVYGFYPWDMFTTREIRAGYFPLWNPYNALGEPHLANMQSAVFYPLTWIKVIANMNHAVLDLLLLLRLFLAGLFMFRFLEELRLNFWAKAFGAASFATTGYFTRYVYMSHLNVEILLPLILLCFGRLAREPNKKWFILSALSVWLAIVGGFPEAAIYALLLGVIWYFYLVIDKSAPGLKSGALEQIVRLPALKCGVSRSETPDFNPGSFTNRLQAPDFNPGADGGGKIASLLGALTLGVVLGLPQLLPFIEYLANAWTYHIPGIGMGHLEGKYAFALVLPWFFGTNDVSPLVPFLTPYIGVAPAVFAIVGAARSDRKGLFFLVAAIFVFGIIYGIYPFILIGKIYPFSVTLNYKYAVPIIAFSISALAGMGLHEAIEKPAARKVLFAVGAIAALIIFAYAANHFGFFKPYPKLGSIRWTMAGIVVLMIVFMLIVARGGRNYRIPVLLLIFSLIYPSLGNSPQYNDDAISKAPKFHATYSRFASEYDSLNPDLNLIWNADDIRYYNPMYSKSYVNIFAKANGLKSPEEIAQNFVDHTFLQPDRDKLTDPLWAKMGLGYWVGEQPGGINLLPDLLIRGHWRTELPGMISRRDLGRFSVVDYNDHSEWNFFYVHALFAHAPSIIDLELNVEASRPILKFRPVIDLRGMDKSDGVVFQIMIVSDEIKTIYSRYVDPNGDSAELWLGKISIDLSQWAGKNIKLRFITTPGPRGDKTSDFSCWGAPSLVGSDMSNWKVMENAFWSVYEQPIKMVRFFPEVQDNKATAGFKNLSGESLMVYSTPSTPGKFVLAYAQYPGWRAYSDSGEVKISSEEGVFMSVLSSNGKAQLVYRPFSFAIGLWTFLTSVFVSLAFFLKKSAIGNHKSYEMA